MPSIIKSSLATLLLAIADGEVNVEAQRQQLCSLNNFEPYAAFSRIDRKQRGVVTGGDIAEFMTSVGFPCSESDATLLVKYYDSHPTTHYYGA